MTPQPYSPRRAWLLASRYFIACFILSWFSGVLPTILSRPLITKAELSNLSWWAFTAVCLVIVFVGYVIIWPKGTLTHGRPLNWLSVIVFGGLWGLSEGQLFVSVWVFTARLIEFDIIVWVLIASGIDSPIIVWVITFAILSAFIGLWHALFWDIYVAPEHNIAEWNGKKVLFAHTPYLIATLTHLTLYNNFGLVVLFQTLALLASTYFMRFPPFWEKNNQ